MVVIMLKMALYGDGEDEDCESDAYDNVGRDLG